MKMTEAARLMLVIQILETLPEQTVSTAGLQVADADPPINESLPSLNEVTNSSKSEGWQGTWHLQHQCEDAQMRGRDYDSWIACSHVCCMIVQYHSS